MKLSSVESKFLVIRIRRFGQPLCSQRKDVPRLNFDETALKHRVPKEP